MVNLTPRAEGSTISFMNLKIYESNNHESKNPIRILYILSTSFVNLLFYFLHARLIKLYNWWMTRTMRAACWFA